MSYFNRFYSLLLRQSILQKNVKNLGRVQVGVYRFKSGDGKRTQPPIKPGSNAAKPPRTGSSGGKRTTEEIECYLRKIAKFRLECSKKYGDKAETSKNTSARKGKVDPCKPTQSKEVDKKNAAKNSDICEEAKERRMKKAKQTKDNCEEGKGKQSRKESEDSDKKISRKKADQPEANKKDPCAHLRQRKTKNKPKKVKNQRREQKDGSNECKDSEKKERSAKDTKSSKDKKNEKPKSDPCAKLRKNAQKADNKGKKNDDKKQKKSKSKPKKVKNDRTAKKSKEQTKKGKSGATEGKDSEKQDRSAKDRKPDPCAKFRKNAQKEDNAGKKNDDQKQKKSKSKPKKVKNDRTAEKSREQKKNQKRAKKAKDNKGNERSSNDGTRTAKNKKAQKEDPCAKFQKSDQKKDKTGNEKENSTKKAESNESKKRSSNDGRRTAKSKKAQKEDPCAKFQKSAQKKEKSGNEKESRQNVKRTQKDADKGEEESSAEYFKGRNENKHRDQKSAQKEENSRKKKDKNIKKAKKSTKDEGKDKEKSSAEYFKDGDKDKSKSDPCAKYQKNAPKGDKTEKKDKRVEKPKKNQKAKKPRKNKDEEKESAEYFKASKKDRKNAKDKDKGNTAKNNKDEDKDKTKPTAKDFDPCAQFRKPAKKDSSSKQKANRKQKEIPPPPKLDSKRTSPPSSKTDSKNPESNGAATKDDNANNLAAVALEKGKFAMENRPMPKLQAPDDVSIAVDCISLCKSILVMLNSEGPFKLTKPLVIGTGGTGIVCEIGKNVKNLKQGDRIAIDPCMPCGVCAHCRVGRFNLCEKLKIVGLPPTDGNLINFFKGNSKNCVKLPDTVTMEEGALLTPLAIGAAACRRTKVRIGHKVWIIGAGPMGMAAMMSAQALGAAKIVVTDCQAERLKIAESLGATATLQTKCVGEDPDALVKRVHEALCGQPDRTILSENTDNAVYSGVMATNPSGVVGIIHPNMEKCLQVPQVPIVCKGVNLVGTCGYLYNDLMIALAIAESGNFCLPRIISDHFMLPQTLEAIKLLEADKPGQMSIIIHAQDCDANNPKPFNDQKNMEI